MDYCSNSRKYCPFPIQVRINDAIETNGFQYESCEKLRKLIIGL